MVIFNSYVNVYQRVVYWNNAEFPWDHLGLVSVKLLGIQKRFTSRCDVLATGDFSWIDG